MDPEAESYDTEAAIINEILFTIGKIAAAGKPPYHGARIFIRGWWLLSADSFSESLMTKHRLNWTVKIPEKLPFIHHIPCGAAGFYTPYLPM